MANQNGQKPKVEISELNKSIKLRLLRDELLRSTAISGA